MTMRQHARREHLGDLLYLRNLVVGQHMIQHESRAGRRERRLRRENVMSDKGHPIPIAAEHEALGGLGLESSFVLDDDLDPWVTRGNRNAHSPQTSPDGDDLPKVAPVENIPDEIGATGGKVLSSQNEVGFSALLSRDA